MERGCELFGGAVARAAVALTWGQGTRKDNDKGTNGSTRAKTKCGAAEAVSAAVTHGLLPPALLAARGAGWVPSPLKVLGAALVLMHTWPPLMLLLNLLMRSVDGTNHHLTAANRPKPGAAASPAPAAKHVHMSGQSPAAAAGKPAAPRSGGPPSSARVSAAGGRVSAMGSSVAGMLAKDPGATVAVADAVVTPGKTPRAGGTPSVPRVGLGLGADGMARRARSMAPLQRLLEAWLQQTNQLIHRYGYMEVRLALGL